MNKKNDNIASILVVDDEEDFRALVCQFLENQGYLVYEAEDGRDAVNTFLEKAPQLILMDADMPVLNGFDACRKINSLPEGKDVPVIIVTGFQDEDSVDRAFDAGALDYVTKPIHWAVLRRRIDIIISSYRNKKKLQEVLVAQKQAEEELNRAKKMEAIGLMAGGVAHDLNNILSGIVGYPEFLLMKLPQDSPLRQPIEAIHRSGLRASEVVADLLTVARGVAVPKETLDLNNLIFEHLNSPEHQNIISQHEGVICRATLGQELKPISCSKVHIKKCLMNLILNGAEAIAKDGVITIATRNQLVRATDSVNQSLEEGDYVVLSVTDTGGGISEDDINRIFEPFYTKKMLGRIGTGLGLAVVWNTVEEHDGHITVQSSTGGTCFEIYFPAAEDSIQEVLFIKAELQELHGQGEKILVIDDEPLQRDLAGKFLSSLEYNVETVKSGEEAIHYLEKHTADLLVLDMIMDPGINGRQTYEQIIKNNPGQKAIVVSGFSEDDEVKRTLELGAGRFLKKPYSMHGIGMAVQQELRKKVQPIS